TFARAPGHVTPAFAVETMTAVRAHEPSGLYETSVRVELRTLDQAVRLSHELAEVVQELDARRGSARHGAADRLTERLFARGAADALGAAQRARGDDRGGRRRRRRRRGEGEAPRGGARDPRSGGGDAPQRGGDVRPALQARLHHGRRGDAGVGAWRGPRRGED